jgi:hypothetical protein
MSGCLSLCVSVCVRTYHTHTHTHTLRKKGVGWGADFEGEACGLYAGILDHGAGHLGGRELEMRQLLRGAVANLVLAQYEVHHIDHCPR